VVVTDPKGLDRPGRISRYGRSPQARREQAACVDVRQVGEEASAGRAHPLSSGWRHGRNVVSWRGKSSRTMRRIAAATTSARPVADVSGRPVMWSVVALRLASGARVVAHRLAPTSASGCSGVVVEPVGHLLVCPVARVGEAVARRPGRRGRPPSVSHSTNPRRFSASARASATWAPEVASRAAGGGKAPPGGRTTRRVAGRTTPTRPTARAG
jgi:hypothetical protein